MTKKQTAVGLGALVVLGALALSIFFGRSRSAVQNVTGSQPDAHAGQPGTLARQPGAAVPVDLPGHPVPQVARDARCDLLRRLLASPEGADARRIARELGALDDTDIDCLDSRAFVALAAVSCEGEIPGLPPSATARRLGAIPAIEIGTALREMTSTGAACVSGLLPLRSNLALWTSALRAMLESKGANVFTENPALQRILLALLSHVPPQDEATWRAFWQGLGDDARDPIIKYNWYLSVASILLGDSFATILQRNVSWESTSTPHGNLALGIAARAAQSLPLASRGMLMRQASTSPWRRVLLLAFPPDVQWPSGSQTSSDADVVAAVESWVDAEDSSVDGQRLRVEALLNEWQLVGPERAGANLVNKLPSSSPGPLTSARIAAALTGLSIAESLGVGDAQQGIVTVQRWFAALDPAMLESTVREIERLRARSRNATDMFTRVLADRLALLPRDLATDIQAR